MIRVSFPDVGHVSNLDLKLYSSLLVLKVANNLLCLLQGNLSEFVKRVPEAQAYYDLEAASTKFAFPEPGFLEGIKTKDKAILKMARVGFT